jgi:lysophospholipase L1-like esterase
MPYSGVVSRLITFALALLVVASSLGQAQSGGPSGAAQWERAIRAFEAADIVTRPPTGGIVFTGSSSIRLWTSLSNDFPGMLVINRGFGGSQLAEVTAFVGRIVTPYRPRQVIVYCGGNDINEGRSAADVLADYQALVRAIQATNPTTRVAYISIAPNPARWSQIATVKAANAAIKAWTATDQRLGYIDVYAAMLGPDGRPKPDIFAEDRLHMNPKGYAIWRAVVGPHLR